MDLQKEFRDVDENDIPKNLPEETPKEDVVEESDEGDKIIKDLEKRLAEIKASEPEDEIPEAEEEHLDEPDFDEEVTEEEKSFLERIQPFILPICLTFFAIVFAGLFLYFFSKSRIEKSVTAITNTGAVEVVTIPSEPVPIKVVEEPLTCEEPQFLNEEGTECLNPEPEPLPPVIFEDGTTTVVNVRFSFDKYNYDNYPRGIYLLPTQIFEGDYEDYKISPNNRAFANDHFFGVDRYKVSLMGDCQYVIDDAQILVKNMVEKQNNSFTGVVDKVINASEPRIECGKE